MRKRGVCVCVCVVCVCVCVCLSGVCAGGGGGGPQDRSHSLGLSPTQMGGWDLGLFLEGPSREGSVMISGETSSH